MSYFCVCIVFRIIKFIFQLLDLFCKLTFSFQLSHHLRISQDIFTDIIFFSFQLISLYLIVFRSSYAAQISTKWFQNQLFSGIPYSHLDLCQLLDFLKDCRRIQIGLAYRCGNFFIGLFEDNISIMFCDQIQSYCFIKKFSVFFIIFSGTFTGINSMPGRFYIRRRQIITPLSDQMFTHSCFAKHLFLICLFHFFKEII